MARARTWIAQHRVGTLVIAALALSAFAASAVGIATATDQPSFCMNSCHEMGPFHDAWKKGPHREVGCVECHVDPGTASRVAHKVIAMQELWSHLTSEPVFPLDEPTPIPNQRCLRCHENPSPDDPDFDHTRHATGRACQACHSDVGHEVSERALRAQGIFNTAHTEPSAVDTSFARVDGGKANIAGHKATSCERCHDMAATGCVTCHAPDHEQTGPARKDADCTTCHEAGDAFVFSHPSKRTDCTSCHKPPAEGHDYAQPCPTCHRTAVTFAFRHPQSKRCTECHVAPKKHRSGECAACHRMAGRSWAFTHPTRGSDCTSCHTRPTDHRAGSCASCHATGVSWRFAHPKRNDCASCHSRPAGHYGTNCSSCHATGRPWRAAGFSHPRVPGGEHSYRSFRCKACHPGGYGSYACNTCHDSGGREDD